MALILQYNLAPGKKLKLDLLCVRLGIYAHTVPPEQFSIPIKALTEPMTPVDLEPAKQPFQEEMLVFCGFDSKLLDQFLSGMQESHIPPIYLKAVMTATNMNWSSEYLHDELKKEHERFHRQR